MAVALLPKEEHEPSALCGYPKGAVNEVSLGNFKRALTRWETGRVIENPSRASLLYSIKTCHLTQFSARFISLDNTFKSCFHCIQPSLSLHMIWCLASNLLYPKVISLKSLTFLLYLMGGGGAFYIIFTHSSWPEGVGLLLPSPNCICWADV
jgi:hypothetical protein